MLRFGDFVKVLVLLLTPAFICPIAVCQGLSSSSAQHNSTSSPAKTATLLWSDEFNGPDGGQPDTKKWDLVENDSGYGNRELEYYTKRPVNLHLKKGQLIFVARNETFQGPDGQTRSYTSARIESRRRFEVQYGRIEARMMLPKGQGLWPAFWMLGSNFDSVHWPTCGEIDIMENVGYEPSTIHGSLHGPGYSGANPLTGVYTLPDQGRFSDGFHIFAIEWEPREIRFYVDGHLFETQKAESLQAGKQWVFDHPFYIVLNLAVGGYWPGNPDATTVFPAKMLVDYVRVYKLSDQAAVD